jgi:uncharacterized protein
VTGTIINIVSVLIGGFAGLLLGSKFPDHIRRSIVAVLGLFTLAIGIQMFLETKNAIIVLGSLGIGVILGELAQIETVLSNLGNWFENRFTNTNNSEQPSSTFVKGFLTASIVFCVGPMTILGSIQDGLTGDFRLLAIKSILDGFAAMAFASTLGIGVLFSTVIILFYQGGLSILAAQVQSIITTTMMNEMTAVGGVILMGIAISSLLEIKPIRVGNFIPALLIAPLIVVILELMGIYK